MKHISSLSKKMFISANTSNCQASWSHFCGWLYCPINLSKPSKPPFSLLARFWEGHSVIHNHFQLWRKLFGKKGCCIFQGARFLGFHFSFVPLLLPPFLCFYLFSFFNPAQTNDSCKRVFPATPLIDGMLHNCSAITKHFQPLRD